MLRGEMKYMDTDIDAMTLGYGIDAKLLMNGIEEGTGASQRIGKRITIRGIQLGILLGTPITTGLTQWVRVVVVQDKQANGAECGWDDVFDDGTGGNDYTSLSDPLKVENRYRFSILYDRTVMIDVQSAGSQQRMIRMFKKVNIPVIYGNTGEEVDDINTNSIYLLVKPSMAAGTAAAVIGGYTRVRYTDV